MWSVPFPPSSFIMCTVLPCSLCCRHLTIFQALSITSTTIVIFNCQRPLCMTLPHCPCFILRACLRHHFPPPSGPLSLTSPIISSLLMCSLSTGHGISPSVVALHLIVEFFDYSPLPPTRARPVSDSFNSISSTYHRD